MQYFDNYLASTLEWEYMQFNWNYLHAIPIHTTEFTIFSPNFHIETKEEVYVQLSFLTFVSDRPMHISQKLAASLDVYSVPFLWVLWVHAYENNYTCEILRKKAPYWLKF